MFFAYSIGDSSLNHLPLQTLLINVTKGTIKMALIFVNFALTMDQTKTFAEMGLNCRHTFDVFKSFGMFTHCDHCCICARA